MNGENHTKLLSLCFELVCASRVKGGEEGQGIKYLAWVMAMLQKYKIEKELRIMLVLLPAITLGK